MAEYDSLVIKVSADTKSANSGLNALRRNLTLLEETSKKLDIQSIQNVQKLLQDIATIDFTNVSQSLHDVVMAFKSLDSVARRTRQSIEEVNAEKIDLFGDSGNKELEKGWSVPQFDMSKVDFGYNNDLYKTATTSFTQEIEGAKQKVNSLNSALQMIKKSFNIFNKVLHPIRTLKSMLGITANQTKKFSNSFDRLAGAFKRIAFYRIVRRIIQEIGKSLGEAIQELAKFDSTFNQSISELKSSFSYLGRSIISMLAPLINLLAPIISSITNQVGQLANQVGQAFSGDTFSQAEQSAEDYAESLKKVKSATLGIDELNVIQDDDDKTLFSEQSGAQFGGLTDTFKDVMDFVGTINESLTQFMTKILPAIKKVLDPILDIVSMIVDLVNVLVENTFDSVNNSLVSFVEMVGSIIGFIARLVENLMPTLVPIIQIVGSVINIINNALGKIFQSVGSIFEKLAPMLDLIRLISIPLGFILQLVNTIAIIVDAIIKTVIDLITLNWGNIANDWVNVSSDIQQSWEQWAQTLDGDVDISGSYSTPSASGENADALSGNSGSQGASVGATEVNVYLDSEQIAKKVEQRNDRRGYQTTFGGYRYNG